MVTRIRQRKPELVLAAAPKRQHTFLRRCRTHKFALRDLDFFLLGAGCLGLVQLD
jgi:hypothetical protein